MQFVKPDHELQCVTCGEFFLTHRELFSHLQSFHNNEMDPAVALLRRQHYISSLRANPNLNSNFGRTNAFQNNYHNCSYNPSLTFRNAFYPATATTETPNHQIVPMTITNNINFIVGHHVQPQLNSQSFQFQAQPQPQPQPHPQPQPQLQTLPQLQPHTMEEDISKEDEVRTLPLIEQLEREWPETIVIEDDEEDSVDLVLKL